MQSQQELRQVALCIALACRSEGHTVLRLLEDATRVVGWLNGAETYESQLQYTAKQESYAAAHPTPFFQR